MDENHSISLLFTLRLVQNSGLNLFKRLLDVKRKLTAIDAKKSPFDIAALKMRGLCDRLYCAGKLI